ncbi:hypothetical protein EHF33_13950 [Deinococcus psychrotolerans]|uniref:ATPase dynein-related AAA domain-containing protein n=1 Tax=Deinococcus psychrotolerans TaxID=2489213 RepID=A0A3G8YFG0_9DEIO|nr:AAA family ATPase [Deinococcus psychrotolerans]AZI44022.1 hypothetical protein EHF33_13950 [Deinococcus psychrotolerans]
MTHTTDQNRIIAALDNGFSHTSPFEFFHPHHELPPRCRSELRPDQASHPNPSISSAVAQLLRGEVRLDHKPGVMLSLSNTSSHLMISDLAASGHRIWFSTTLLTTLPSTVALMAMTEALTTDFLPYTRVALRHFIKILTSTGNLHYPMTGMPLPSATLSVPVREALWRLCDTIDAEVRLDLQEGRLRSCCQDFGTQQLELARTAREVNLATLIHPPRPQTPQLTPISRLNRLIKRGGAALLVGTFKTETAKRCAVENNVQLVLAKGAPGVEDRDFLGGVYPTANGPQWVDGPISRAFVLAQTGKTVLLIDEILRYQPEALNVLIGALDSVSRDEALKIGLPESSLVGERFYLLPLPNGEHLCCPAANLTWLMTTNLGEDHLQTADRIDAALLSRIDMVIEFLYPDEQVARALYERVGGDRELADLAYQIELITREGADVDGGLLIRPADARKTLALIKETLSIMEEDGLSRLVALECALPVVIFPHCCPRDMAGQLDEAAVNMLRNRVIEEVLACGG